MRSSIKKMAINVFGGLITFIGVIFIVMPGPAFLLLPVGLAILSLEHEWAKLWLKRSQRMMRVAAVNTDKFLAKIKRKIT